MQRLDEHFFRTKVFSSLNKGVLKERFYCSLRNFLHFLYSLPVLLIQCAGAWAVLLLSFEKSICWLLSCFELFFSLNLNSCSSLEEPDLISLFSVVGDNKTENIIKEAKLYPHWKMKAFYLGNDRCSNINIGWSEVSRRARLLLNYYWITYM